MKKRREITALVLASAIACAALTACGSGSEGSGNSASSDGGQKTEAREASSADTGSYEVVTTWMNFGSSVPSGMPEVEEAINEIVEPELGVTLKLLPVGASNMASEQNLMISAGDKVDLIMTMGAGNLAAAVSSEAIIPLDDLFEQYGVNIKKYCPDNVQYFGEHIYGIPVNWTTTSPYGFLGRKDIFEKYGFSPVEGKLYSIAELEEMFDVIKAGEGDNFYMLANIASNTDLFAYMYPYHAPNGYSSGALVFDHEDPDWSDNTTFENVFASDAYREYAETMHRWAQKGFISPDAGSNMDTTETLMKSGNFLGQLWYGGDDAANMFSNNTGYEIISFRTQPLYSIGKGVGLPCWSVSATSQNPEKAFQFLDYLYGDNNIDGMLQFGLEGRDYVVVDRNDNGDVLIDYPEGLDSTTVPYYEIAGIYGDRFSWPIQVPSSIDMNQKYKNIEAEVDTISPAAGYLFDSREYSTDLTAIDAVVNQYQGIITSGAIDPEIELAEFNNALEAAGIDRVIEANQAQFDAWRASR